MTYNNLYVNFLLCWCKIPAGALCAPFRHLSEREIRGNGPVIELKHLSKTFSTGEGEFHALEDVSLTVQTGDIFGIVGMSGAGKSTLVRCINLLEKPTSGHVIIDGQDMTALSARALLEMRRSISMIFQQFNLLMQRTCLKNICFPMEIAGVPAAEAKKRALELLDVVGLPDKADAYPAQLSGGQKQRIAIARALASDPKVLLCDEATSALDPTTTRSILRLIQDINKRLGITVIIITHEMAVIRQICTHVAILDGGQVAEEGSVDDVFTHTRSEAGRRLFGFVSDYSAPPEIDAPVDMLRIVFDGMKINEPVISEFSQKTGIAMNILHADINLLNGKRYGQMTIERPKKDADAQLLIDTLTKEGIKVQEVRP